MNWLALTILIIIGCLGGAIGTTVSWMLGIAEWSRETFVSMYAITITFMFWIESWEEQ